MDISIPPPAPTPTPRTEKDIEAEYEARIGRGEFIHDEECHRFGTEKQKIERFGLNTKDTELK